MIFIRNLQKVLDTYDDALCGVKDKARLYGMCKSTPPLATHIVFEPMPKGVMQDMVSDYKQNIPKELLLLYEVMNGADLFWTVRILGKKNIRIPISRLSIYGVPLTWDRKHIEPFNIRIEDLNRPDKTPDAWLKFGSYYNPSNIEKRLDLFVDTETSNVFSVEHGCVECRVVENWNSIDNCLCSVFDSLCIETD